MVPDYHGHQVVPSAPDLLGYQVAQLQSVPEAQWDLEGREEEVRAEEREGGRKKEVKSGQKE